MQRHQEKKQGAIARGCTTEARCHCWEAHKERGGTATEASSSAAGHRLHELQVRAAAAILDSRGSLDPLPPPSSEHVRRATHLHTLYQGDKGQHMLRKETAIIQTKNSPHTKKLLNPHELCRDDSAYKQPSKTTLDNCFS